MYISSPYWTCRISRLDRVFRNTTLPLSPLSLCELSSLNHPSLIPPLSSPCDFEAFYQATVPTCARLRLPLSPFFSYRLSPLKISPRGLAPFGRTSWTARAFTTRASHQDYQLDFHLNLLPSFSLGLYCSSAELTYASTRTFALTLRHGFFNLVYRLAWIEGKLTAYPADLTARDFGKIDSLIKCFRVIHGEIQPFIGAPVTVKTRQSKSRTPPVSSVGSAPTPTSSYNPGTLLPLDTPLAPPTPTPTVLPRLATVPRI